MKKLLSAILATFVIFGCANEKSESQKRREEIKTILSILALDSMIRNQVQYEASSCTDYSPGLNIGYPVMWPIFHTNITQYTTVIIGDSTMHGNSLYSGFLGSGTQSVAIGGNTACDMITQLPAINTINPSVIIVSTNGGNDMLGGVSNTNVINTVTLLVKRLHQKFPNAKLVIVGIHPTLNSYGNANKGAVNTGAQNALIAEYPAGQRCYVNPLVLFGVAEGQAANAGDMADSIHYSQNMAFQIKNKIQTDCGIVF